MKNRKLIIILTLLFTVGLIGHLNYGLFQRHNFLTAYFDKWAGQERIVIYGERFESDSLKTAIASGLGFKYERLEDCTVTNSFVQGVDSYNAIMGEAISDRLGEYWVTKLEKEIQLRKEAIIAEESSSEVEDDCVFNDDFKGLTTEWL